MELRAPDTPRFIRSRPLIECAQCGERLFVPEWSEFVDERRVRHLWTCETCGYAFETTVRFAAIARLALCVSHTTRSRLKRTRPHPKEQSPGASPSEPALVV